MKKKVIKLLSIFIFLFIFKINAVSALNCVYGTREGDNSNTWEEFATFNVDDGKIYIDKSSGNSSFLKKFNISPQNLPEAIVKNEFTYYEIKNDYDVKTGIYISLFSGADDKNKCPSSIKFYKNGYLKHRINSSFTGPGYLFFHDIDFEKFKIDSEINVDDVINLIEKESKDKKESEIISPNDCQTYTSYINKIKEVVDKKKSCDNNIEFDDTYKELRSLCDSLRTTSFYNQNDILRKCNTACSLLKDDVDGICASSKSEIKPCGSLGSKIIAWMFKIIKMVRYIVPALIIILSILDFIKALSDEEKMKEATSKFFKRLIAAALIFIVPFILDFILKKFSIPGFSSDNPFCAL